ncbi:MAG: type II toxin-antitoxin system VapC family toxin [Balneolaceae bacterium]
MSKLLVDTNVLIYGIDQDSQFYERARIILDSSNQELTTTSKNISEFLAVVTKAHGYGLSTTIALEILHEIIEGMEVLYPSHESMAIFLDLLDRHQVNGKNIHDLEIAGIAIAHGVIELATFNTKDFETIEELRLINV